MTAHVLSPVDMTRRLIGFDTTSRNSNLALIDFVRDYLDGHGVASHLTFDDAGGKANLLASIGPEGRPGTVLSGYVDVVPVDGQAWTSDPFEAVIKGGRIVGRGAADMKGFVATVLALVPEMRAAPLQQPLHIALTYDEEVGCKGVPRLLDQMEEVVEARPAACLVGEPTSMTVVDGHKGKAGCRCTVTGREGHSALTHEGVNAVVHAARLIAHLDRMQEAFRTKGPFAEGFSPPCDTMSVGRIEGGSALNIIPGTCTVEFEFRTLPGRDPRQLVEDVKRYADDELLPSMRAISPDAGFAWEELLAYPGLGNDEVSAFEHLCRRLTGTGEPKKVSFGTEAGHFAARQIPAVVCGPGSIAVAHRPDEYIEIAQLDLCAKFLRGIIADSCAA